MMKKQRKQRLRRLAERALARKQRKQAAEVVGKIKVTVAGFGFVTPDGADGEIFVPAKFLGGALDGDRVRLRILPPRKGHPEDLEKGDVGKVEEVVERSRSGFVGELLAGSVVRPLNPRLPDSVAIHGSRKGAKRGDWVRIRYDFDESGTPSGSIVSVIGHAGDISADLDAVVAEYELPARYGAEDDRAAAAIAPREIDRDDCRELFVLTVDPFDAKDFDDALSVARDGDGNWIVGVHIADVAAYIVPKSRFDEAARLRGFSCYLPGRTLPMLPPSLTGHISMTQDTDSLAHSVFLTVTPKGEVVKSFRRHTVIRVRQRLDYDELQKFFDGADADPKWSAGTVEALKELRAAVRAMRSFRDVRERPIDLPLPEVRVVCDEAANRIVGLERRMSREAEQLVEECMLAANQSVGLEMSRVGVAGIYRVHPEPAPEKTVEFSELMHESFQLPVGDISDRKTCREFIAALPDDGRKELILNLLLRSMARASYGTKGDVHFALGKTFYAHFTSPIRRYADLTVHQQLWNFDRKARTRSASTLEHIAESVSEQEENIDAACFAAADRLKLRLLEAELENHPDRLYDGIVTKVVSGGLQVEVAEYGVYGFVEKERLFGRRSFGGRPDVRRSEWQVGDFICLRLHRIDFARGSALFTPAR